MTIASISRHASGNITVLKCNFKRKAGDIIVGAEMLLPKGETIQAVCCLKCQHGPDPGNILNDIYDYNDLYQNQL